MATLNATLITMMISKVPQRRAERLLNEHVLILYSHFIAKSAHRMYKVGAVKRLVDFIAQIANVHFNRVGQNVGIVVPNVADNAAFGKHPVGVAHHVLKKAYSRLDSRALRPARATA